MVRLNYAIKVFVIHIGYLVSIQLINSLPDQASGIRGSEVTVLALLVFNSPALLTVYCKELRNVRQSEGDDWTCRLSQNIVICQMAIFDLSLRLRQIIDPHKHAIAKLIWRSSHNS